MQVLKGKGKQSEFNELLPREKKYVYVFIFIIFIGIILAAGYLISEIIIYKDYITLAIDKINNIDTIKNTDGICTILVIHRSFSLVTGIIPYIKGKANRSMTCYIFFYDTMALFEIVLLSYMFNTKNLVKTVGLNRDPITSAEGITVKPEFSLDEILLQKNDLFVFPGGDISKIKDFDALRRLVAPAFLNGTSAAAICAGLDILEKIIDLSDYKTIKNTNEPYVHDRNVISARPEAYITFAIEAANEMNIFTDENDYKETYLFFRDGVSPVGKKQA